MDRPITTLFMLMSVDGKISTGSNDSLDVDNDFPHITGVKEGLHQYYDIEQTTDLWSLNSGRVLAKVGTNDKNFVPDKTPVSFVIIDNNHMEESGIRFFMAKSKNLVIVTSNPNHPAYKMEGDNLHVIKYTRGNLDMGNVLMRLKRFFGCDRITVQTGGTLNGMLLREKLFDYVDIVVAPILIGGGDVSTLIDGESIKSTSELGKLGALKLVNCKVLQNSYLRLTYKVIS